ncbi:glycoside hydrolase family 24 protein [Leptolyngbya sp. AN02str]|uniref:glycoside hydrolase family 24 protein n=1 Tax=Leptolyngbya sp. AN02str TaxID=3423363 RepID=UPI003D31E6D2
MSTAVPKESLPRKAAPERSPNLLTRAVVLGGMAMMAVAVFDRLENGRSPLDPMWDDYQPAPLVMEGGDPYLRALMRTISASEANDPRPYSLLYGGDRAPSLDQHPDICIPIVVGPNVGDCTTAAGRYQFLSSTWEEQARKYHPKPDGLLWWEQYSFAPEYQDWVMHNWLDDPRAWNADLSELLRDGQLDTVLYILSPTWTSLGYGIETNSMTASLPVIYEEMLAEELVQSAE